MNKERCKQYKEIIKKQSVDRKTTMLLEQYSEFKEKRRKLIEKNKEESLQVKEQPASQYADNFDKYKSIYNLSSSANEKPFKINLNVQSNDVKIRCNDVSESVVDDNSLLPKFEQWFAEYQNNNNKLVDEVRGWIVDSNVPQETADKLLKILNKRIKVDMPKTSKTLLQSNITFDIKPMKVSKDSIGEFYYFGINQKLKDTVNVDLHDSGILELMVHIDGISPFKSSTVTVWPILCKVYTKEDNYEPFTVAVFAGDGKPETAEDYLCDFVKEINELQKTGILIHDRLFQLRIKYFICDTPARSFVKCIVGHCAFAACERCKVRGIKVDKVTVFLDTSAEKINDGGFRSFEDPECHTFASPLIYIQPPINIVQQFILDPMHLLYLGCTKRLLEYLLKSDSRHTVRLSASLKSELSRRTKSINSDIPEEFPRKMRCTSDYSKYKAVEFKFFALYAAPVVLKKLVSDEVYNSFMLFTTACRLMTCSDPLPHVPMARRYFKEFVDTAPQIYGSSFLSLNVHNLIHLCDDVETTRCNFNELSAFCFESYLGSVSSMLRSPTHIVAQYCRRVLEKEKFATVLSNASSETKVLIQRKNKIIKLKFNGMILSSSHPNNTVLLKDWSVAVISQFICDSSEIQVEVKKYLRKNALFQSPCDSELFNIWEVDHLSSSITTVHLEKVLQKFVNFQIIYSTEEATKNVVVPLLH